MNARDLKCLTFSDLLDRLEQTIKSVRLAGITFMQDQPKVPESGDLLCELGDFRIFARFPDKTSVILDPPTCDYSCPVCGADRVYIRGRRPGDDRRLICPTCIYESYELSAENAKAQFKGVMADAKECLSSRSKSDFQARIDSSRHDYLQACLAKASAEWDMHSEGGKSPCDCQNRKPQQEKGCK